MSGRACESSREDGAVSLLLLNEMKIDQLVACGDKLVKLRPDEGTGHRNVTGKTSKTLEWRSRVGGRLVVEVTDARALLRYYFSREKSLCDKPRQSSETIRADCSFPSLSLPTPQLSLPFLPAVLSPLPPLFPSTWEVSSSSLLKPVE